MATTTVHVRAASRGAARTSVQPDILLALPRCKAEKVKKSMNKLKNLIEWKNTAKFEYHGQVNSPRKLKAGFRSQQ